MRDALFPPSCAGCGVAATALCTQCAPPAVAALRFRVGTIPVIAAGPYGGALRSAVLAMKHGERAPLVAFAPLLAALVPPGADALVPLPTTWWSANRRGFDQAEALARRIAARGGPPMRPMLRRVGGRQFGKARGARLAAQPRFRPAANARALAAAVLIDDVVTTGATVIDAARVLAAAGVTVAAAVVVARADDAATSAGGTRFWGLS